MNFRILGVKLCYSYHTHLLSENSSSIHRGSYSCAYLYIVIIVQTSPIIHGSFAERDHTHLLSENSSSIQRGSYSYCTSKCCSQLSFFSERKCVGVGVCACVSMCVREREMCVCERESLFSYCTSKCCPQLLFSERQCVCVSVCACVSMCVCV